LRKLQIYKFLIADYSSRICHGRPGEHLGARFQAFFRRIWSL